MVDVVFQGVKVLHAIWLTRSISSATLPVRAVMKTYCVVGASDGASSMSACTIDRLSLLVARIVSEIHSFSSNLANAALASDPIAHRCPLNLFRCIAAHNVRPS